MSSSHELCDAVLVRELRQQVEKLMNAVAGTIEQVEQQRKRAEGSETKVQELQARNTALVEGINAALWLLIHDKSDDAIRRLTDVITPDATPEEQALKKASRELWRPAWSRGETP